MGFSATRKREWRHGEIQKRSRYIHNAKIHEPINTPRADFCVLPVRWLSLRLSRVRLVSWPRLAGIDPEIKHRNDENS